MFVGIIVSMHFWTVRLFIANLCTFGFLDRYKATSCLVRFPDPRGTGPPLVDRPTQLICISDIYLFYVNRQIQKTQQGNLLDHLLPNPGTLLLIPCNLSISGSAIPIPRHTHWV